MILVSFTQGGGEYALPWAKTLRPYRPNSQPYKTNALWQGEVSRNDPCLSVSSVATINKISLGEALVLFLLFSFLANFLDGVWGFRKRQRPRCNSYRRDCRLAHRDCMLRPFRKGRRLGLPPYKASSFPDGFWRFATVSRVGRNWTIRRCCNRPTLRRETRRRFRTSNIFSWQISLLNGGGDRLFL